MPAGSDQRCPAACECRDCRARAEVEAGLLDLVEDGVLALRINDASQMVFTEATPGSLSASLERISTAS